MNIAIIGAGGHAKVVADTVLASGSDQIVGFFDDNPALWKNTIFGLPVRGPISGWRDQSVANTIFVIGGADGLSPDLRRKATLKLAFGAATWPHQIVRVMLLEQIYRAATILAGHPYHRA